MRWHRISIVALLWFAILAASVWSPPASAAVIEQQAVSAALARQVRGDLKKFYAARGFAPLWAVDAAFGPEARALLDNLASADLDGLKPSTYKVGALENAIVEAGAGDPARLARAELKLSAAFARYVRDLRKPGRNEMGWLDDRLRPRKLETLAVLNSAALSQPFAQYAGRMGWMNPHYLRIREILARAEGSGAPPEDLRRLRRNLDRARVLPGAWTHHIVVDTAAGQLDYYQAGKRVGTMRVVVGTPETPTPMLAGMLQYAILNPYWNVPVSLAQSRIAPRVLGGRSLTSMGYEALSDWSATPQRLDARKVDWRSVAAGEQEIRLRQLPGPANSMGRVKLIFPNDDGIYLHDTPERGLFAKSDRHLSNGCVRLEDAANLGKWLMGRSIRSSVKTPEEAVALPMPVPVFLTYLTATDGGDGSTFHPDVYDRDR